MVKTRHGIWLLLAAVLICYAVAQQQGVSGKKKELSAIRDEIKKLEGELKDASRKEKVTYETIDNINKQNFLLNRLIASLRGEELARGEEIERLTAEADLLQLRSNLLKENYARYVRATYKGLFKNEWLYVLNSVSIRQAMLRFKYLRSYAEQGRRELAAITETRDELLALRSGVEDEKAQKYSLRLEKQEEENRLKGKLEEKKTMLAKLRTDKAALKKELDVKRAAEKQIERLITDLIAKAEAKLRERNTKNSSPSAKSVPKNTRPRTSGKVSDADLARKGRLAWPVSGGTVIRHAGENTNTKLKTVTLSYGIDIKVNSGQQVRTVLEGEVSVVQRIPGYGSVVIITHNKDFRTVYAHLDEIYVAEGEKIKTGTAIGSVGESIEGYVLHFGIWNDRNYQDPEAWLAAR